MPPWILVALAGALAFVIYDHRPKKFSTLQVAGGQKYRYTVEIKPIVSAEILNFLGMLASSFGGTFHGLSSMTFSGDTTVVAFDMTLPQTRILSTSWMAVGIHQFRIVKLQPL